jgi:hypothetical protein
MHHHIEVKLEKNPAQKKFQFKMRRYSRWWPDTVFLNVKQLLTKTAEILGYDSLID